MDHSRPEDLHPARLLAGGAARPLADLALHVHLGRGLREREERGAEPHPRVGREEAPGERGERGLEVHEGDPFVDREPLDLLEHGAVRGIERVAAVHLPRDYDPDGRRVALQGADLHGRRVGAQQHVSAQIERVLGIHGRMVLGEVERGEVIALGLGLRPDGAGEAELVEDLADLVHHLGDEVETAPPLGAPRHREVELAGDARGRLERPLVGRERLLELALQGVRGRAGGLALRRGELRDGREDLGERTALASQNFRLEVLEPAVVRLRDFLETLPQRVDGCEEVAHAQSACLATSASCWNAAGSRTARSANTFRLISTPARRRPFIMRL